ncbi:LysR family transcriptional regulator [uncultured Roseibium sp.]|uniref:LysR family transcriptional regulator n=1 Tax=uncultured Roseibium sp. TaxID=1936171 RepID=UPI0032169C0D
MADDPKNGDRYSGPKSVLFNWNDLVYFLELARQRNLSGAARRLHVDHTTVSRRIRELENALNVKLFSRTRQGFNLTDAGVKLLDYAEAIESKTQSISTVIGHFDEEAKGIVRVATMEALGSLYLAPAITEFNRRNPYITIELVTAAHWINLSKREADILLSFPAPTGRRLNVTKIGEFRLWLYASPTYLKDHGEPQKVEDLKDHRFIDYIDDQVQIDAVRWLSDAVGEVTPSFRSSSLIAQFMSASSDGGIAMLPTFVATHDKNLSRVLPDKISVKRDIWLTVHEDLLHLARVNTVAAFFRDLIARDQPFLNG